MSNPVTFSSQSRYSFIHLEEIKETASGQEFRLPMNIDFGWRESTEMLYCVALLDMERKRNIWTPITLPVYTKRKNCPKSTHFSWVAGCLFCICCHLIAGLHRQRERNNGGINRKTVWLLHVWTGQCVRCLGQILYMNSLGLSCYFSVLLLIKIYIQFHLDSNDYWDQVQATRQKCVILILCTDLLRVCNSLMLFYYVLYYISEYDFKDF